MNDWLTKTGLCCVVISLKVGVKSGECLNINDLDL